MEEFKPKKVEGRVKMLRVLPYKGCPVYIRMIGDDYFEYMVIFKNEIYSSYIIITPEKGKNKLTKTQIGYYADLIRATAEATVDALLGTKVDKEVKEIAKILDKKGSKNG